MTDFDWDAPVTTATKPEPTAKASTAGLIPCMNAWVEFAWDVKLERFRPTVVDVSRMESKPFGAWCERVREAGGFATPVCLDASDAADQSRALFVAHSYSPGYASLQDARREFSKLVEADWARELLRRGGGA